MSFFGGATVGFATVFILLIPLTRRLLREYPGRTGRADWIGGLAIALAWSVAVTVVYAAGWPESRAFVDGLTFGIAVAPIAFLPDIVAALRRRRLPEPARALRPVRTTARRSIAPVAFGPEVHSHFAEPEMRARYLVAAYRRRLVPAEFVPALAADLAPVFPAGGRAWAALAEHDGGDGLDDAVDLVAHEIGYLPTPDQERSDAVERLVYMALCSTDPAVRLATVELLAPPIAIPDSGPQVRWRIESRQAEIEQAFAVRYDGLLTPGVERHFTDPTVRARELIAGFRRGVIFSPEVPQWAARVVADLPGAGEAWTELAMAHGTEPRSELLPILDRAAEEIGYARSDEEAEADLLESAAYRAILTGEVARESERLRRLERDQDNDDHPFDYRFDQAPELEALRDAEYICGDDYFQQVASVRAALGAYLAARYP